MEGARVCRIERGRVIPNLAEELRIFSGLPFTIAMVRRRARRGLTFESARKLDWDARLAMHRIAVTTALTRLADMLENEG